MPDRRTLLADAAIEVLADHGLRGLTHRSVDAAAGLPQGSTSNVFRTRQSLVDGAVERFVTRDLEAMAADALRPDLSSPEVFARQLAARSRALVEPPMDRITRARMELALHPGIDLSAQHEGFAALLVQLLEALGASDPGARARAITDYLDGLIFHALAMRSRHFDTDEATLAIAALIGPCDDADRTNIDFSGRPPRE